MKDKKCLLLKTPEGRHFFTHENNFTVLVEFGRTFGAEISVVKTPDPLVLELEDLAKYICSQVQDEAPKYEVLEIMLSASESSKPTKKSDLSKEAYDFIRATLLDGKSISISDLATKFTSMTRTTLSSCIQKVKKELIKENYKVVREKPGQYKIQRQFEEEKLQSWAEVLKRSHDDGWRGDDR